MRNGLNPQKENMNKSYKSICANKGRAGVDGIGINEIKRTGIISKVT